MFYREHKRVTKTFTKPSRTKQQFKAECDINTIMAKYRKTGIIEHMNRFGGQYGDFTETMDYQEALNLVGEAREMFMSLPASIRTRFDNDPGKYLAFVQDPANHKEMVKMGLATARPETALTEPSGKAATPPAEAPPEAPGAQK